MIAPVQISNDALTVIGSFCDDQLLLTMNRVCKQWRIAWAELLKKAKERFPVERQYPKTMALIFRNALTPLHQIPLIGRRTLELSTPPTLPEMQGRSVMRFIIDEASIQQVIGEMLALREPRTGIVMHVRARPTNPEPDIDTVLCVSKRYIDASDWVAQTPDHRIFTVYLEAHHRQAHGGVEPWSWNYCAKCPFPALHLPLRFFAPLSWAGPSGLRKVNFEEVVRPLLEGKDPFFVLTTQ